YRECWNPVWNQFLSWLGLRVWPQRSLGRPQPLQSRSPSGAANRIGAVRRRGRRADHERQTVLLRRLRGAAFFRRQRAWHAGARNRLVGRGSCPQHGGCSQCTPGARRDAKPGQPELIVLQFGGTTPVSAYCTTIHVDSTRYTLAWFPTTPPSSPTSKTIPTTPASPVQQAFRA